MEKKFKNANLRKYAFASGVTLLALIAVIIGVFFTRNQGESQVIEDSNNSIKKAQVSDQGDLIIPISEITSKASFYEYEVNSTKLEVIAIKDSDGTIRTAFNTCQVCYSSGRGYYVQEGDLLVCQNCGNRFEASDLEVSKGGCNPVPIFSENKTVDDTNITISKEFLEQSKDLFETWKL